MAPNPGYNEPGGIQSGYPPTTAAVYFKVRTLRPESALPGYESGAGGPQTADARFQVAGRQPGNRESENDLFIFDLCRQPSLEHNCCLSTTDTRCERFGIVNSDCAVKSTVVVHRLVAGVVHRHVGKQAFRCDEAAIQRQGIDEGLQR